jgi:glycosyltransferase involved in cell wall biosynthesis
MPKVSIIVPVYNTEKYLARCLDSLIGQTLDDIEIICVNDGSTDKSQDILEKYKKRDGRIRVITNSKTGIGYSRNVGIELATGEFIGFVDSDDFLDENFYEVLYSLAKKTGSEIVCSSIIRENLAESQLLIEYECEKTVCDAKDKFELVGLPQYCFVWNKIYSKDLISKNSLRFEDNMLYEDMIFTPKAVLKANSVTSAPSIKYHYWKRKNSAIKNDTDKARSDKLIAHQFLQDICRENSIDITFKADLEYKCDYNFFGIKILKLYKYKATKRYYLFGIIPVLTVKEYV